MSVASLLAVSALVLMPGAGATLAAFRPGVLRVETAIALCFGLGYTVAALTATVLAVTGTIGRTSFAISLTVVTIALWGAAFSRHSARAHLRALAADARCNRWTLVPGLAGLTAFAIDKLRLEPVSFMSSEAAWRYWGDGLEILRAGGVPASTLQWGIHIPTTVSKVVLNSFEAGVVSVAPNGALPTMAAVVWLGGVGLFAALLALGRAVGLRVLAVGVPVLVLAVPASAPINAEFTQDADVYRVETLGRMAAVCAVVIAIGVVRGRAGLREAAVAGVLLGAAAGTHLIPVAVFGIFLVWYIAASLAVNPARRHRLARIARAAGVTALLTVVIWLAVLAASGGDLGFQRARGSGGYPGFPVTLDPTKSFEVIKRTHPKGRRTGWAIPPARVGEVALASVFEDLQVTTPRRDYVGLVLLALASGLVIWRRRRSLGPVTFASWATALTLTAVGLYFSHRYRTFVPATFGPRRLFEYGILFAVIAGVAALSTVVRSAVGWAARDRRRALRRAGAVCVGGIAVVLALATAPAGVTPDERAGLAVMATVARTVPCNARILVNVRTAGSFEVLAGRTSVDEGMAPYLRPPVLRRVLPIVLGAHRFFRDPASNRAFIENQHVDVVVAVAGARVGGRPILKQGRRGVLDDVPWLRPLLNTPTVAIYATSSLAQGAKSCYKAT
ncbi:MAG: hypothetical protein ACRDQE_03085 [Gaiellales bacterium]